MISIPAHNWWLSCIDTGAAHLRAASRDLHAVGIDGLLDKMHIFRAKQHDAGLAKLLQQRQQLCERTGRPVGSGTMCDVQRPDQLRYRTWSTFI